jgi:hypothetical protein
VTPEQLIERFRSEVHDTGNPPLWTDDEVVSYLDEAQKWYCRLTGGISDSTSEATRVDMVTNEPFGVLDDRILKVRYAKRESDNVQINLLNFEDIENTPTFVASYTRGPSFLSFDDDQTGDVSAMVTGMEEGKVRWVYVPAADDTALLIVSRLPLETITPDNLAPLEIRPQDHHYMLSGMKAKAYAKEDAETYNKTLQEKHESDFVNLCVQGRRDRERREHKYRTVAYGGI